MASRKYIGSVTGITSMMLLLPSCGSEKEEQKPNVILFLADDLGYGDLACYNTDGLKTPAIESIADQGVRFTSFYSNGPESSPTRAALLTGRYQQRVGGLECAIGTGNVGRYDDAIRLRESNDLGLPVNETSIANMLRDAGYITGICGKWHLGYEEKFNPNLHGFEFAFYALSGGMDYFHHKDADDPYHLLYFNGKPVDHTAYFTDLIGEESIKFLDAQTTERPFFLYVPFTAVHAPYQGPDDFSAEILTHDSPLWNQGKGPKNVYQAMLRRMDETIGKILRRLEEKGMSDNTIVVFMSDNGGTLSGNNAPLRGNKSSVFEGGIRVPCVIRWPKKISPGLVSQQPCVTFDISASIIMAAGASIPENRAFDGIDILKLIEDNRNVDRTLYWRIRRGEQTRKAVRDGNLKYIWLISGSKKEEYLFDLGNDLEEENNLIASRPEEAARLKKLLIEWEKEVKPVR